jgi:hypothetical protein
MSTIIIDPQVHEKMAQLGRYSNLPNYPSIILAKDAVPGETYLLNGILYKVNVERINRMGITEDSDTCTSVTATLEPQPFYRTQIAGGTELIPYSPEWHKWKPGIKEKKEKLLSAKERRVLQSRGEVVESTPKLPPRSEVIDQKLAEVHANDIPDWEAIATAVISRGLAKEDARKGIISQSKQRHKWYTVDGKVNPALSNMGGKNGH